MEATFRFVPRFEPVVDEFDQVVTDVILKTLHPNVFDIREIAFDRNSVMLKELLRMRLMLRNEFLPR